jgi:hypothetical protein
VVVVVVVMVVVAVVVVVVIVVVSPFSELLEACLLTMFRDFLWVLKCHK